MDGIVALLARALEILYMEASKKDSGVNNTKCLHDTRKLFKLMKDAHDAIHERTATNVREEVVTFGFRILRTIFTLLQHPGSFYQAIHEVTMSLYSVWMRHDTDTIIGVISWIFRFRKTILTVAESILEWTSLPRNGQKPDFQDYMSPTMTSPQLRLVIFGDDIPPLDP